MGRTALKHTPNTGNDIPEDVAEKKGQAAQELALIEREVAANVTALAAELSYDGPLDADSLHKEVLSTGATLARAIFFHGSALLLLREATLHGDWEGRLAQLPFSRRTAYNYMTIALKFKDAMTREALANLGPMKLLELAALDDGEIEAFTAGQSVRGITLDETEKMSHKELRTALHELKAEHAAGEEVRADLSKKLTKLQTQAKRIQTQEPDDVLAELSKEANSLVMDAVGLLKGNVRQALAELAQHYLTHGGSPVDVLMAGMVGQLQAEITQLREAHDLPDVSTAAAKKLAEETAEWAFPQSNVKA